MSNQLINYKRNRFTAKFNADYLYTPAHYWFHRQEDGSYRCGLTKFAARMLGELVEFSSSSLSLSSSLSALSFHSSTSP